MHRAQRVESDVSDPAPKKQFGPVDKFREQSGLYKLGFDMESMKGFGLPFIAMAVPVVLAILMVKYL
jgi:hypothetical protein